MCVLVWWCEIWVQVQVGDIQPLKPHQHSFSPSGFRLSAVMKPVFTQTHMQECIYVYMHFWLKILQYGAHLLWLNSIIRKCHSLLCYLFLRTKPTFVCASGLPASLPETQQVFSISLRPMNDKEHRQQIRNNFKHWRNINRTLTASSVIFFFEKEHTAQQSHPTLKIPTQNSCKRQNPLPRSLSSWVFTEPY